MEDAAGGSDLIDSAGGGTLLAGGMRTGLCGWISAFNASVLYAAVLSRDYSEENPAAAAPASSSRACAMWSECDITGQPAKK